MKANIIETIKECPKKAFFRLLDLKKKGPSDRYRYENAAIKKMINTTDFTNNDFYFVDDLMEELPDELYFSQSEKRTNVENLHHLLRRYAIYEQTMARTVLHRSGYVNVEVGDQIIYVSYNLIVKNNDGTVEIISFDKGSPTLSNRARLEENKPENSIGLYLLYKAGKQMYPENTVIASFYHLKHKDDTGSKFEVIFENKPNKNIVSCSFNQQQSENLEEQICDLLSIDLKLSSDGSCDKKKCKECFYEPICTRLVFKVKPDKDVVNEPPKKAGELKLTDGQREAISFEKGIARVNAAAGTGKTTVISLRLVELIKNGVRPQDILLITFTNKAAQEMVEKVQYWLTKQRIVVDLSKLKIFTFNGFSMHVIEHNYEKLGFTQVPSIIDMIQKYDIIFSLLDECPIEELDMRNPLLNFPKAKGAVVQLGIWFNRIKVVGFKNAKQLSEDTGLDETLSEKVFNLYQRYNAELKNMNWIEYDDQIKLGEQIIRENPEIQMQYYYKHIMIDEYQDTDPSQVDLIRTLVTIGDGTQSLMVVGDDSQAIYKFRLADQNNILNFNKEFQKVKDIFMVENFRSTQEILNTANLLNEKNEFRIPKDLINGNGDTGELPELISSPFYQTQVEEIKNRITALINSGLKYHQICIIARTGYELTELKEYLEDNNIPCSLNIPVRYIHYAPVQDIIALAESVEDKANSLSYLQFLTATTTPESLRLLSLMNYEDTVRFVNSELDLLKIPEEDMSKLTFFYNMCDEVFADDDIAKDFVTMLKEKDFHSMSDLVSYCQKMNLYEDNTMIEADTTRYNAVNLITAHSSKGKEYDVVFILLDKFGNNMDWSKQEDVEEERRLLFVSITRAKKILNMFYRLDTKNVNKFTAELEQVKKTEISA